MRTRREYFAAADMLAQQLPECRIEGIAGVD